MPDSPAVVLENDLALSAQMRRFFTDQLLEAAAALYEAALGSGETEAARKIADDALARDPALESATLTHLINAAARVGDKAEEERLRSLSSKHAYPEPSPSDQPPAPGR